MLLVAPHLHCSGINNTDLCHIPQLTMELPTLPKGCHYWALRIQSDCQCSLGVLLPPLTYNREKQGREMWDLEVLAHLRRQMLLHSALQGESGPPPPWLLQLRPSYHILGVVLLSS